MGVFYPTGPHISARRWNIKNLADGLRLICLRAKSLKLHRHTVNYEPHLFSKTTYQHFLFLSFEVQENFIRGLYPEGIFQKTCSSQFLSTFYNTLTFQFSIENKGIQILHLKVTASSSVLRNSKLTSGNNT